MKLQIEDLEVVAIILRRIWFKINALIYENQFKCSRMVVQTTIKGLEEFHQAQSNQKEQQNPIGIARELVKWKKI